MRKEIVTGKAVMTCVAGVCQGSGRFWGEGAEAVSLSLRGEYIDIKIYTCECMYI